MRITLREARVLASMRPPDLPGGNAAGGVQDGDNSCASMRPPDLPGGNLRVSQAMIDHLPAALQ